MTTRLTPQREAEIRRGVRINQVDVDALLSELDALRAELALSQEKVRSPQALDIAQRLAAHPSFKWKPGMRSYPLPVRGMGATMDPIPDLEDPATVGLLLEMLMEAGRAVFVAEFGERPPEQLWRGVLESLLASTDDHDTTTLGGAVAMAAGFDVSACRERT